MKRSIVVASMPWYIDPDGKIRHSPIRFLLFEASPFFGTMPPDDSAPGATSPLAFHAEDEDNGLHTSN
uniref:Uncharacterized protein n=1 Tax=Acrobeloides nanus TaxID=290746 RepID=A0A914CYM3_9BILA